MRLRLTTVISLALMMPFSAAIAQEDWALLPEDAACLIENLDSYLGAEGEPVVIMLRACPVVDSGEALRALQQNSGAQPHVIVESEGVSIDEIIVYSQAELLCLRDLQLEVTGSPVRIPRDPCD